MNALVEKIKELITVAGIFYIFGFIITKTHLLRYKINITNLIQARYISVGFFFLITLLIVCLPFLLIIYFPDSLEIDKNQNKKPQIVANNNFKNPKLTFQIFRQWLKYSKNTIIKFICLSLLGIGLSHTLIYRAFERNWLLDSELRPIALKSSLEVFASLLPWYYLMIFGMAFCLFLLLNKKEEYKSIRKTKIITIPIEYIVLGLLTVFSLTAIKNYSYYVYPNITSALGGWSPKVAQIITKNDDIRLSRDFFPIDQSSSNEINDVSSKVILLEESSDSYFFLVCNKKNQQICNNFSKNSDLNNLTQKDFYTIQIKKDLVKAMIY
jgi:hypothetical protein